MEAARIVATREFTAAPTLAGVQALLRAADLPTAGLTAAHLEHFFCSGPADAPSAIAGVELFGPHALLRSVVVRATARSHGLGSSLVAHVERYAQQHGVCSIYLLTTTAEQFFDRLGYRRVERADAPETIRASSEFANLCPASATFMHKALDR